ncbi:hypothetical protein SAMN05421819_3575 [Bryocella elongata]|uniref:NlpC/P60 domain-containing protein n=1 Tax=Bryocella elongata TaxID=863522 RepID=A0A1H6B795_9BACT|nr:hydrolase [Bryocella elongata]SEG56500.1 hypothetical protein SAMN05421819_3575 [Bryocella elongata]
MNRAAVLAAALAWEKTPYHPNAAVCGCGADCALFPLAVYQQALAVRWPRPPRYVSQWHLHRSQELYLEYVRAIPGVREIDSPEPGDFALFRLGRVYSHGAIVLAWPQVVHAENPAGVVRCDVSIDSKLSRSSIVRPLFFTFD